MAAILQDLFGDSDDDGGAPGPSAPPPAPAAPAAALAAGRAAGEEEEEEARAAPKPKPSGPPLDVQAPLLPPPPPGVTPALLRLSNILREETRPYDPATHQLETEDYLDDAGQRQTRTLNVLRWRHGPPGADGQPGPPQSNARFIRWSDGSVQLQVGTEVLDVAIQDVTRDHSHLFVRHPGAGGIVQAVAPLASKLNLRPSSLHSRSHTLLSAAIAAKHAKSTKLRAVLTSGDPEALKRAQETAELAREAEADKLRRRQEKGRARTEGAGAGGADAGGVLSAGYLEGDDDQEAPPLRAAPAPLAAKPKAVKKRRQGYVTSDDEDDDGSYSEGEDTGRGSGKRRRVADDDDD